MVTYFQKRKKRIWDKYWVIKENQGKGVGTGLLDEVIKDADNEGVTLFADPVPEGVGLCEDLVPSNYYNYDKKRERLIKLYKKFGFELKDRIECGKMIRKPHL
jgi:GNAT superfamily N-acetyltransferase